LASPANTCAVAAEVEPSKTYRREHFPVLFGHRTEQPQDVIGKWVSLKFAGVVDCEAERHIKATVN
jgi:hypothetical protein